MKMTSEFNSTEPEREALERHVIQGLIKQRDLEDLTLEVCQQTGWDWQASQEFIDQVQVERRGELAFSQIQLFLYIGLGMILAGTIVIGIVVFSLAGHSSISACKMVPYPEPIYTIKRVLKLETEFEVCLNLNILSFGDLFFLTMIGAEMILGGSLGVYQALQRL